MARIDHFHDPNAPNGTNIVVAVSAFVQDERGLLLMMIRRTDNDLYSIPGGAQDVGETIGQAVIREVKEDRGSMSSPPTSSASTPIPSTSSPTPTARYGSSSPSASGRG